MCPNLKIGYHKGNIWEAKGLFVTEYPFHFICLSVLYSVWSFPNSDCCFFHFFYLFWLLLVQNSLILPLDFSLPRFDVRFLIVSIPNRVPRSSLTYSANTSLHSHSANRSHHNFWSVVSSFSSSPAFFISSSVRHCPTDFDIASFGMRHRFNSGHG